MWIVKNKKIFFGLSILLSIISIGAIVSQGFNLGIDFTGGTLFEVNYKNSFNVEDVENRLSDLGLGELSLQPTGEQGLIIKTSHPSEEKREEINNALREFGNFEEERFTNIGPTIGEELKNKAYIAIAVVVLLIILFIAWAFRKIGEEKSNKKSGVSPWTYGLVAVIALVHDILIPTGIFTWLGHLYGGFEINALFITALLAILGYSVNDTIVVFDRVRENILANKGKEFKEVVGESLGQTITRSINTSLTTLIVLLFLFFFGGEATEEFSLVLILGVITGTYSSIFLAAPLLTVFRKKKK